MRLMDNHHRWDCAYPGVELLPDGRILSVTYKHWTQGESPWIAAVHFPAGEMLNDLGVDQPVKDLPLLPLQRPLPRRLVPPIPVLIPRCSTNHPAPHAAA